MIRTGEEGHGKRDMIGEEEQNRKCWIEEEK